MLSFTTVTWSVTGRCCISKSKVSNSIFVISYMFPLCDIISMMLSALHHMQIKTILRCTVLHMMKFAEIISIL